MTLLSESLVMDYGLTLRNTYLIVIFYNPNFYSIPVLPPF